MIRILKENQTTTLILTSLAVYLAFVFSLHIVAGISTERQFDVGDARWYWSYAQNIDNPFFVYHLPLFPFLVAIVHFLAPGLHPLFAERLLSLFCWSGAIYVVYRILCVMRLRYAFIGAFVFGMFFFTGMTSAVFPIADPVASFLLTLTFYAYITKQNRLLVISASLGLFTHKVLWVFLTTIFAIGIWYRRLKFSHVIASALPFSLYYVLGIFETKDIKWIFEASVGISEKSWSKRQTPIFSGLVITIENAISEGSITELIQAGTVLILVFIALIISIVIVRSEIAKTRGPNKATRNCNAIFLGLSIPVLLLGAAVGSDEIWIVVRYGKFLIIPAWRYFDQQAKSNTILIFGFTLLLGVAFLSQIVFAWYSIYRF